jgi:NAD(P)-dependent dehydrogenase (short-subunit alcohol dehydrogenase family)
MGKFDGKSVVVTGGAMGIGEATVRLFVQQGAFVVIADIDDDEGEKLAKALGSSATFIHTDVSVEADVAKAVNIAATKLGHFDCMINNAGIMGSIDPIDETSVEMFDNTMGVNLRGTFLGIKHAARLMKKQGYGSIITTASIGAVYAGCSPPVYNASKAAVIQLTRSLAIELGPFGIRINCILPGYIATPLLGKAAGFSVEKAREKLEPVRTTLSDFQPIKRSGIPEDIANAALWLASEESGFVNGVAMPVDGGCSCGKSLGEYEQNLVDLTSALV